MARLKGRLLHRTARRRAIRASLVTLNVLLMALVAAAILLNPGHSSSTAQPLAGVVTSADSAGPVDQLASVDIAVTAATMANLPESAAVINQADSEHISQVLVSANNAVVNKPQVVASAFVSNKDIRSYVSQAGDSVSSVAAKFGITSDSVRWSNNLSGETLSAGQKLLIPPVTGIVYTVKVGDTADSLAAQYHASAAQITADNDAEITGLRPGERIIIPNGSITVIAAPSYSATTSAGSGLAWGYGVIYGFNGYDFGNCTWYVATQIAVPANWGNAYTWAAGARASGWNVSSTPTVGAIAQTPAGGLGHVGIVIAVSGDQVEIRDMNNYGDGGGFDRVGQEWVPFSYFPNYITR